MGVPPQPNGTFVDRKSRVATFECANHPRQHRSYGDLVVTSLADILVSTDAAAYSLNHRLDLFIVAPYLHGSYRR